MIKNNTTSGTIDKLNFLCGHWIGHGNSLGDSVKGTLVVQHRFQNTFIELTETLCNEENKCIHEDCTWIAFDEKKKHFHAVQFMAPGMVESKMVLLTENGCRWWMGPQAPWVDFISIDENHLRIEIRTPLQPEPETWITYKRQ